MTRGAPVPVLCRQGCGTGLVFAKRVGENRVLPYEAADQRPFSDTAVGSHVLISGESYTPLEAIEHFRTQGEGRSEDAARELVSGFPWHRPHRCEPGTTHPTGDDAA